MRKSSIRNRIAKSNTDRTKKISITIPELIGRKVVFQILIIGKTMGRARPYLEYRTGKVKEVHNSLVIIEGSRGELYNRPVGKVSLLEEGKI